MKSTANLIATTAVALGLLAPLPAFAERVLRLDEAPVGELDPAKGTDYGDTVLSINLYDSLVLPARGGPGLQASLATGWSVDGATYTFTLRDDVTFNGSGNPLTANDVVFSFNRLMAMGQGPAGLFEGVVANVSAPDDHIVVFELTQPFSPFLSNLVRLGIVDSAVVSQHFAEGDHGEFGDYGSEWLSQNSAGSGPYMAESHAPQTETVLVADTDYFREFVDNYPERVRYRFGLDAPTVRALMARGEHDISSQWLPPEVFAALAEEGMTLLNEAGSSGEYFRLNTRRAPLDDVHCRRALAYAFDYNTIQDLVRINAETTSGRPMSSALPQGLLGYSPDLPVFETDMARAQEELAACQYDPADYPLEISWIAETPARERGALMMQAIFSQLGFDVSISRTPWALVTEQVTNPPTAPHIIEIAVAARSPDTDSLLYTMYHSSQPHTWQSSSYLQNAEVDELLDAARVEPDQNERQATYERANALLAELVPDIYAYELLGVFAVRPGVVHHNLEDPARTYAVSGYNLQFMDISIND